MLGFRWTFVKIDCIVSCIGKVILMDSFPEIALNILKTFSLTPTQLIRNLLNSETKTIILNDIEYSVKGLHVNFELLAKAKTMDTPASIYFYSDH